MQISERIQQLSPSATLAMSQKSAELRASGVDVINMSVGEPDFDTPHHIKEAAKQAIDDNFSRYTPVPGYLSLRKEISRKLADENGLHFAPEQVVVGNGAKQELCNAVLACVNPGDEVIIPVPAWVSYVEMVKLAGGKVVTVHAGVEQNFKVTPRQIDEAITPHTRLIMFNSPSNPTGAVYTADELEALARVIGKHEQVIIIADEIYEHINFLGTPLTSIGTFSEVADRTIVINGVSKAYAMTGWRIGYLAAPAPIAKAVTKLQGQYTSGASSIAQKAAEAAYAGSRECVKDMCRAFKRRRDLIVELALQIEGWEINCPDGAFYLFPRVEKLLGRQTPDGNTIATSGDYTMYLLEQANVATVDGAAFCAPGYIRLSYALSDEEIRRALTRIKEATARLK